MTFVVRRWTIQCLPAFSCALLLSLCLLSATALAQHPAGRVGSIPPVTPAPPIVHVPVYRQPIYQAPVYRAPYQPPVRQTPNYTPAYVPHITPMPWSRPVDPSILRPPRRPFRPVSSVIYVLPVLTSPFWNSNFCWWALRDEFWTFPLVYNTAPQDLWNPANFMPPAPQSPLYVYGDERRDIPQLFLKDGTMLYVNDYWLVENQLHFMLLEGDGMRPTEQVIPFDELDLQRTVDVNTQRGFHFMLRNEPFEQYVRDHPDGPPLALTPQ